MATTVSEITSRCVASLRPDQPAMDALRYLIGLNIHAAPVLDPNTRKPLGMLSLSDLHGDLATDTVRDRCSSPAASVTDADAIDTAKRVMSEHGFHHLVVVDGDGRAVGFLCALDLLRADLGLPVRPLSEVPFFHERSGLKWSPARTYDRAAPDAAPAAPGYFVITADDRVVWAERCRDVRARLQHLWAHPPEDVVWHAHAGPLSLRVAEADPGDRMLGVAAEFST